MFTSIFPHSQASGWVWFSGGLCDHKPGCIRTLVVYSICHSPQYSVKIHFKLHSIQHYASRLTVQMQFWLFGNHLTVFDSESFYSNIYWLKNHKTYCVRLVFLIAVKTFQKVNLDISWTIRSVNFSFYVRELTSCHSFCWSTSKTNKNHFTTRNLASSSQRRITVSILPSVLEELNSSLVFSLKHCFNMIAFYKS